MTAAVACEAGVEGERTSGDVTECSIELLRCWEAVARAADDFRYM